MGITNEPIIFLLKKMWKFSTGNRKNIILYFSLFLVANIIGLIEPLLMAKILNVIQEQGITQANLPGLIGYLSIFLLLAVGFWGFHGPARVIELKNSFIAKANYRKYLLDGTMNLPAHWHTDHHSGDTIDKIEKATDALWRFSGDTFLVIETIVRFIGSYIALAYFNLHSSYILLFMVIITVTVIIKFDKVLVKHYRELYRADNRISAKIFDIISNITTVIILRIEKLVSKAIFKKIMEPLKLYVHNHKVSETKWFLVSVFSALTTFFVLGSYVYSNVGSGGTVFVGTLFALYGYVGRINDLFFRFAYRYGAIVRQRTAVQNVEEISDKFQKRIGARSLPLIKWKELQVKNLRFSYHGEEGDVHLDNISLKIQHKEKIALIGSSGSGKTTLLKVIRELYKPQHLELSLDGKALPKGFKSISSNIALIPQDPEIFSTTVKENITLGIPHSTQEIKKYTDMARFTQVAERLPHKLNSSIVEKGVNLSGGEKQRLALARGLLACEDKAIILLDEPTSSVDTHNELLIYENIFKKFKNKTVISSIHRLHLLPLFDTIYFFKNGKILASGTFKEMLRKSVEFRAIWRKYNYKH